VVSSVAALVMPGAGLTHVGAGSGRTAGTTLAFSVNPISWLGDGAAGLAADAWKSAMTGLWSAGLWMLKLAFGVIDAFTTPDVTGGGPLSGVLPTTLWIGATVAALMMFVQLSTAMVRRDGQSLGRVLLGVGQFAAVWAGYLGVAAVFIAAASGLEHAIVAQLLHVQSLSGYDLTASWPRKVSDVTVATVLGVSALLLVIPAAFAYLLIMLVREAALVVLVATAPITAAGLLADATKTWFWKSLRWFISCVLIAPTSALVLGIGVKLSEGVVNGKGDKTAAAVGTAVVGAMVIAIGATTPMVLFRLLSFVDPGTASGAALRQSWSDAGGMSGVLSGAAGGKGAGGGAGAGAGSSAASASGGDGRSGGESTAEAQTQSRMAGMLGSLGGAVMAAASVAQRATDIGSDVLGQAGVGSPGYSMTPTDERSSRRNRGGPGSSGTGAGTGSGTTGSGGQVATSTAGEGSPRTGGGESGSSGGTGGSGGDAGTEGRGSPAGVEAVLPSATGSGAGRQGPATSTRSGSMDAAASLPSAGPPGAGAPGAGAPGAGAPGAGAPGAGGPWQGSQPELGGVGEGMPAVASGRGAAGAGAGAGGLESAAVVPV